MTMADIAQTADEFLAEHGYGRWGQPSDEQSQSVRAATYGLVASDDMSSPVDEADVFVANSEHLSAEYVITDGRVRLLTEAAALSEDDWNAFVTSAPWNRPRGLARETASAFVGRMGRLAERKALPMMDGTEQGDVFVIRPMAAPGDMCRLERWAERAARLRHVRAVKAAKASKAARAERPRSCGHAGDPTEQQSADGTWTCPKCRNAAKAKASARKRRAETAPSMDERVAAIREQEEREAAARERLAEQRLRMATGHAGGRSELLDA